MTGGTTSADETGTASRSERVQGGPGGGTGGALSGFGLIFEGFRWLRRERALRTLALIPLGFSILASGIALTLVTLYASELYGLIVDLLPVFEVSAWYQWLWLGPARLFFWLLSWLIFAASAALAVVLGLLLANLAAAPFLDALSRRVEQLFRGQVVESQAAGLGAIMGDVGRSVAGEAQRTLFFVALWLLLMGTGFVIPGAHFVTGPLMMAITIVFLPLEFSGYALDRRQVPFAERRRWIVSDWPRMLGFGAASFLACFVPLVNLAMMPVLVVAGTLLVLRGPPEAGLQADSL